MVIEKDRGHELHRSMANKEVLQRVNEERNIRRTITRIKIDWIGHILRRKRLLQHVFKEKMEGKTRKNT